MFRIAVVLMLSLWFVFIGATHPLAAQDRNGDISTTKGAKSLSEDGWKPAESSYTLVAHDTLTGRKWTGNFNLLFGMKDLNEDGDEWELSSDEKDVLDNHKEIGVSIDFRKIEWPINVVIAFYHSFNDYDEEGFEINLETSELRLGVRKIWELNQTVRLFLGGGFAFMRAVLEWEELGDKEGRDDWGPGAWINSGVYLTFDDLFNVGLELGYSRGEVEFEIDSDDGNADMGGPYGAIFIGLHW